MKKAYSAHTEELNIVQILQALLRKCWVIFLSVAICGGSVFYVSSEWITPRYESAVTFFVNNDSFAVDNRLSSSDLYVSEKLMDTYIVILTAGSTVSDILEYSGENLEKDQLVDMLTIRTVPDTVLFQVTVNGTEPEQVGAIAKAISHVLPQRINSVLTGASIAVADAGTTPTSPATPNVMGNTISAVLFGCVFGASLIVLQMLFNTRIRDDEDIPKEWNLYVLTKVPEYVKKKDAKSKNDNPIKISREQAEAYRFLRTNLGMSLTDTEGCRVIGITSALSGEGKSTTAVNLAWAFAMDGRRVLLVDCDLRKPTVYKKLNCKSRPGITALLAARLDLEKVLQTVYVNGEGQEIDVLTAGLLPPNPAELLNSQRMQSLLQSLRQEYDWIILDFPPLGEVSDALTLSRNVDAYMLVSRSNYCQRKDLYAAIQQIDSVEGRVLGIVLNCAKK